jgi:hypothetical protein
MTELELKESERPPLPKPLKSLYRMGRNTAEIAGEDKILVISLGGSALDFLPYYTDALRKYNVKFQVGQLYQSDKPYGGQRKVIRAKRIEPFGCDQAIIFDDACRTFKSMVGAFDWVLPRAKKWSIPVVHTFIMKDEKGSSNSTELPVYKDYGFDYKGPLTSLYETSSEIYNKLQFLDLTKIISTYISSIHLPKNKSNYGIRRVLAKAKHRPSESQQKIMYAVVR